MSEQLKFEVGADKVAVITLNRPERKNAVNNVMWDELFATLKAIARNPVPFAPAGRGPVVIRSTSASQRRG